jgi:hypothetical protein
MKVKVKVVVAVPQARTLRSGEDKGQVRHSVDLYLQSENDLVPSKFSMTGLADADAAAGVVAKYPPGSVAELTLVPRDVLYLDPSELKPLASAKAA